MRYRMAQMLQAYNIPVHCSWVSSSPQLYHLSPGCRIKHADQRTLRYG